MPYNLTQKGKNIEIAETREGVFADLKSLIDEIIKRENNFALERVYYLINGFNCEIDDFFIKLKSGIPAEELLNTAKLQQVAEIQKDTLKRNLLQSEKIESERKFKQEEQKKIYSDKQNQNALTLKDLLNQYVGYTIGVNVINPSEIEGAILVATQSEFFTVNCQKLNFNIPYSQIIRIVSCSESSVKTGIFGSNFPLIIKVFDFVIYKGAVGLGVGLPIEF